jgi:surface protein
MKNMFLGCIKLSNLNISKIDTSDAIYMDNMFNYYISFEEVNISSFNTENVISMKNMFKNYYELVNLEFPILIMII